MTANELVKQMVKDWNDSIDYFMDNDLPGILQERGIRVHNGKICMNDWFKAMQIVREQNFYERGYKLLKDLRSRGYDVKMDMQSNKLCYYGLI